MKPQSAAILLADANPVGAQLVVRAFRTADFENLIHIVSRGEEALQYLKGEGPYTDREKFPLPGLLLLEIALPGIDGWGVLSWLSHQRNFPFMGVVVFTGLMPPGDKEKARDLGASAYEVKPPTFEELVKVVDKIGNFWLKSPLGKKPQT